MQENQIRECYIHQQNLENPTDTPHSIRFCPSANNIFALASWDQTLRVYEIVENSGLRQLKCIQLPALCLSMDFTSDGTQLFLSLSDKSINVIDSNTLNLTKLSSLPESVYHLRYILLNKVILTINESNFLEFYNPNDFNKVLFRAHLGKEISAVDISKNVLLLGNVLSEYAFVDLNTVQYYGQQDFIFVES